MNTPPLISLVMGSKTDWPTLKVATTILDQFNIEYEKKVVSAHRTPVEMQEYAQQAADRGIKVIIAAAGGAAHLPGMIAANTILPVLGVPISVTALNGVDALLSIVQMPGGVPVGTLAIGEPGAKNAAYLALRILAIENKKLQTALVQFQEIQRQKVLADQELN
ncbi:MAG: 5-(carboxyamino)imidazole ribonucleotide mutase [Gammaproteobacteria bacterium]|nr:5-(carboxyamino)imidazole ribonucleotide mutase [Gammaproteobacteria bacterium]